MKFFTFTTLLIVSLISSVSAQMMGGGDYIIQQQISNLETEIQNLKVLEKENAEQIQKLKKKKTGWIVGTVAGGLGAVTGAVWTGSNLKKNKDMNAKIKSFEAREKKEQEVLGELKGKK